MYKSLRPIYDTLYGVLRRHFAGDGDAPVPEVNYFERGMPTLNDLPADRFPLAFLEWGRVSDIELFQSPEEYSYVVTYRLFYLIQPGLSTRQIRDQVFRELDSDGNSEETQWGIGEFAQDVTNFFWQTHQPSRFSEAWDDQDDWSILDLTMDSEILSFAAVTDQTLETLRELLEDRSFRAVQIIFSFEVREREGFA